MVLRRITELIVHATATRPDFMATATTADRVAEIRRWHLGNGWADIGYHYLIDRDGTRMSGRPLDQDGAHVAGRNRGTIGIALFGGHGSLSTDAFSDHYTSGQEAVLRELLAELRQRFGNVPVTGHNQYAAKACPGFNVAGWLRENEPHRSFPERASAWWDNLRWDKWW